MSEFALLTVILLGVGGFVLGMKLWVQRRVRRLEGRRLPPEWARQLPPRVLLFLTAPWCSVCKAQRPLVRALEEKLPVLEIDLSAQPDLAQALGIFATPTYLWVEGGRIHRVWVGAQSPGAFEGLLKP